MTTGQLFVCPVVRADWTRCPPDEITWLDRGLLSGNEDLTLHRAPRCPGLRYVHHRWELFSRDTSYRTYLAPDPAGAAPAPDAEAVRKAATHILPMAPAHYEALPFVLEEGPWLVSVAKWVVRLRLAVAAEPVEVPPGAPTDTQPVTQDGRVLAGRSAGPGGPPGDDAVARVRAWFDRNGTARLAMAFYYQEYVLGLPAPQTVPMMDVVVALDLSGEGAISDYKKLLQGLIWNERGHSRNLAGFLLSNGLITPVDLDEARQLAARNERSGASETARKRLAYRPKGA
ncbi:MAG TPA: hypothetical protein VGJ19_09010 [Streptosporangiaceae bacterium]